MHQRYKRVPLAQFNCHNGQHTKCQTVDDYRIIVWNRLQPSMRDRARRVARPRISLAQVQRSNLPAELFKFGDNTAIVDVTAGWRSNITRHRECDRPHRKLPSYQARAMCDSEIVTRSACNSFSLRPNNSEWTASASRSKIYLVKNSVVVLHALSSASSSRLR